MATVYCNVGAYYDGTECFGGTQYVTTTPTTVSMRYCKYSSYRGGGATW